MLQFVHSAALETITRRARSLIQEAFGGLLSVYCWRVRAYLQRCPWEGLRPPLNLKIGCIKRFLGFWADLVLQALCNLQQRF